MKAVEWQRWLASLPTDLAGLQMIRTDLQKEIVQAETRLRSAVNQGKNRGEERAARVELTELNSKLMPVQTRLTAA
ncbi:hypothetical protein E7T06_09515 [Deinococcus sp. Arct2-2]|uniref:hypothetical protein n=1 Tax=Deinococcus sp. Arct2-2 TaxID=2568653 RepID=UPI0010A4114C|nr:hypothetical protein [Deinococcus sp. Arct2-2]THF69983.1 hypothetical protein E7T06_09515 [Deinococcus sp. Arct2-2]